MTEPHLAQRLPWSSFAELVANKPVHRRYAFRQDYVKKHRKCIEHFARCLAGALNEFAAIDQSSEDERVAFDPHRSWHADRTFYGANMGYLFSIIYGYLELNMILTDTKLPPVLLTDPELKRTIVTTQS